jgi:hypothetical protein
MVVSQTQKTFNDLLIGVSPTRFKRSFLNMGGVAFRNAIHVFRSSYEKFSVVKNKVIDSLVQSIKGRTIEPIEVIEAWGLCHHLACVIKYLARTKGKHPTLEDLYQAEWYLNRELEHYERKFKPCFPEVSEEPSIAIETILENWKLSSHLENALINILNSRRQTHHEQGEMMVAYNQYIPLSKALGYLRLEITNCRPSAATATARR